MIITTRGITAILAVGIGAAEMPEEAMQEAEIVVEGVASKKHYTALGRAIGESTFNPIVK